MNITMSYIEKYLLGNKEVNYLCNIFIHGMKTQNLLFLNKTINYFILK